MTRVCILSSVHPALDNRVFYREARSLLSNGYDVTVVAIHGKDEIKDGIRIIALPRVPRWKRPVIWKELLQRARKCEAEIFHFHDPELLLISPLLRLLTGKPVVYDIHEVYADFIKVKEYLPAWLRNPIAWMFRWLEPLLARLQSGLIFADEQIAGDFRTVSLPKVVLPNFPDLASLKSARQLEPEFGRSACQVVHVGAHTRLRGAWLMLDAFEIVLEQLPDAKLVLVGPFYPPELEKEIKIALGLRGMSDAVEVVGPIPFSEIGSYLSRSAIGWVPLQPIDKYQKNVPTKLFEYMAFGLPVVCSDLDASRPFVEQGLSGYLVTADDPMAHASAIVDLLIHEVRAGEMGLTGRRLIEERYNWQRVEHKLLELYATVLGN